MARRSKKQYLDDDGRTIASMDHIDSPYASMFFPAPLMERRRRTKRDASKVKPQNSALPALTRQEERQVIRAVRMVSLLVGLGFFAVLALFIFLYIGLV